MTGNAIVGALAVAMTAATATACGPCGFNPDCEAAICGLEVRLEFDAEPRNAPAGQTMNAVSVNLREEIQGSCPRAPERERGADSVRLRIQPLRDGVILHGDTVAPVASGVALFQNLCVDVPFRMYLLTAGGTGTLTVAPDVISRAFEITASPNTCPPDAETHP